MKKNKRAFSLIATIFVMVMFLLLGTTLVSILSGDVISSVGRMNYLNAFYAAQGGIYTAANLLLLNDYDWENNNYTPGGVVRNLPAGVGYPPGSPFTYTGSSDSNAVSRGVEDPQFEFAQVDAYITWVKTDEAISPNQEPNWPGEWLGWTCVIDSNGHAQDSSARVTQQVNRYLCPTLKYGISASPGRIDLNAGAINFDNVLSGQPVALIAPVIALTPTPTGQIRQLLSAPPHPLQPIAEYRPILESYEKPGPLYFLDPGGGDTGPVFVNGDIHIIRGGTINGLVCATGNILILNAAASLTVNGGLIAGGNIIIYSGVDLTVNSDSSQYIPDGNFPAMVAVTGSIRRNNNDVLQSLKIKGLVFAGGDIDLQSSGGMIFEGAISSNGATGVKLKDTDSILIKYNPKVRLTYGFKDSHTGGKTNNKLYYGEWREELVFHEKPKP